MPLKINDATNPTFITGANAKVQVGGLTWAYASDVSYQIVVDTIPVETMGRYEAAANEPVNYSVAGSLSVVRYTKHAAGETGAAIQSSVTGNGAGASGLAPQLNPGALMGSGTFDLVIYQKSQTITTGTGTTATVKQVPIFKITDCRFNRMGAQLTKRGILVDQFSFVGILANDDSFDVSHSGDKDLEA